MKIYLIKQVNWEYGKKITGLICIVILLGGEGE